MNIPDQKAIRTAFSEGKEAVGDLFGGVTVRLEKQIEVLKELQVRLSKNSCDSRKAPSSDGYGKANRTESLRKPGRKKPNGGTMKSSVGASLTIPSLLRKRKKMGRVKKT